MTPKTKNTVFFEESKEQSKVKAKIVADYLWAWSRVVAPTTKKWTKKIAYIDLFAGPGRYNDGTKSTPLLILEKAIADSDMQNMLQITFNDSDPSNSNSLQQAINSFPSMNLLKNKPEVFTGTVDEKMAESFEATKLVPSLIFLDPWGYKGLSYRLINAVIKDWGCDCVLFFNYNRINMGLLNIGVEEHMNALFGSERVINLRKSIKSLRPSERETIILAALSSALQEMGAKYILPFRFRSEIGNRISHHLVFITKHPKGYNIMKEIMGKASSDFYQGVPSFEFSYADQSQLYLMPPDCPLDRLKDILPECFPGKCLTLPEIYEQHNVGTQYVLANYRQALIELENIGKVSMEPSSDNRPKRHGISTLSPKVLIKFSEK